MFKFVSVFLHTITYNEVIKNIVVYSTVTFVWNNNKSNRILFLSNRNILFSLMEREIQFLAQDVLIFYTGPHASIQKMLTVRLYLDFTICYISVKNSIVDIPRNIILWRNVCIQNVSTIKIPLLYVYVFLELNIWISPHCFHTTQTLAKSSAFVS